MKQILILLLVAFTGSFALAQNYCGDTNSCSKLEEEVYIISEVITTVIPEGEYEDSKEFK